MWFIPLINLLIFLFIATTFAGLTLPMFYKLSIRKNSTEATVVEIVEEEFDHSKYRKNYGSNNIIKFLKPKVKYYFNGKKYIAVLREASSEGETDYEIGDRIEVYFSKKRPEEPYLKYRRK